MRPSRRHRATHRIIPYPSNPPTPPDRQHRNWIFIAGEPTGWRITVIYTFTGQIRHHRAEPFAYFEWVFGKLMHNPPAEELESLLPIH